MINFEENTEVFESAILNYLIKIDEDYELYDVENEPIDRFKVIKNISPTFFYNPEKEKVFEAIKHYVNKYGKIPTVNEIHSVIGTQNYEMDMDEIEAIFSLNLQRYKPDFLYEYLKTFILKGNLDKTINGVMAELRTRKVTPKNIEQTIDEIKNRFNEEMNIDLVGKKRGFNIMDPIAHIQAIKKSEHTGFAYLDKVLGGGWEPGTLVVFEGPPKVGKSLVLGNIAVRAFFQKLNVGLYTVELSAAKYMKRLGSNAFNIPYTTYKDITDEESTQIVAEAINNAKEKYELGTLIVEEGPTGAMTTLDVENFFLHQEKELGIKFDVILVDYINLLKYYKGEATLYEKIKAISEELRKIAKRNHWCIITATQVKASYFNADDLFLDSTAESSGLVATVDSLFGLIGPEGDPRLKIKNIANRDEGHMGSYKYFRKVKKYYRLEEDWSQDHEYFPDDDIDTLEAAMEEEYKNLGAATSSLGGNTASMHVDSSIHDIIDNAYKRTDAIQKEKMGSIVPEVQQIRDDGRIDPDILAKFHAEQEKTPIITDVPFEDLPEVETVEDEPKTKEYDDILKKIEL